MYTLSTNLKKLIPVIVLLSTVFNCTTDPVLVDPDSLRVPYVESKISPDYAMISVVVGWTRPESMPQDVSGARVILSHEGASATLDESIPGVYTLSQHHFPILPSTHYSLRVQTDPSSVFCSAAITVPGDFCLDPTSRSDTLSFRFHQPSPYSNYVQTKGGELSWASSQNALCYELKIIALEPSFPDIFTASLDTVISPRFLPHWDFGSNGNQIVTIPYEIAITARDSSFLPPWDDFPPDQQNRARQLADSLQLDPYQNDNITGGQGYFSAVKTFTDTLCFKIIKEN